MDLSCDIMFIIVAMCLSGNMFGWSWPRNFHAICLALWSWVCQVICLALWSWVSLVICLALWSWVCQVTCLALWSWVCQVTCLVCGQGFVK